MSLEIQVRRSELTEASTVGEMFYRNSPDEAWNRLCWTLEDPIREVAGHSPEEWKIKGNTAIPYGSYATVITFSQKFNRDLPLLLNVPGFEGIRIHGGNTAKDTEGCILVAKNHPTEDVIQGNCVADVMMLIVGSHGKAILHVTSKGNENA